MTGRRLGIAMVVLAAALLVAVGVGAILLASDEPAAPSAAAPRSAAGLRSALRDAHPAVEPFSGLTEVAVGVGDRRLRLVVADSVAERGEGLRRRRDLGSYDGMLFVFPEDSLSAFTMSTVPVALDIGFYDEGGRRISKLRMEPCPAAESACPLYQPTGPFRYAVETLGGRLPAGSLGPAGSQG